MIAEYSPENPDELLHQSVVNGDRVATFEYEQLPAGQKGCFFCKKNLQGKCYSFTQSRVQYDRNEYFIACSDRCPVAMRTCRISKCIICTREYVHMRYDYDKCVNCTAIFLKK